MLVPPETPVPPLAPGVPPVPVCAPPVPVEVVPAFPVAPLPCESESVGSDELQPMPPKSALAHINPVNETATPNLRIIASSQAVGNAASLCAAHVGMAAAIPVH